jgi:hypothetical protein
MPRAGSMRFPWEYHTADDNAADDVFGVLIGDTFQPLSRPGSNPRHIDLKAGLAVAGARRCLWLAALCCSPCPHAKPHLPPGPWLTFCSPRALALGGSATGWCKGAWLKFQQNSLKKKGQLANKIIHSQLLIL